MGLNIICPQRYDEDKCDVAELYALRAGLSAYSRRVANSGEACRLHANHDEARDVLITLREKFASKFPARLWTYTDIAIYFIGTRVACDAEDAARIISNKESCGALGSYAKEALDAVTKDIENGLSYAGGYADGRILNLSICSLFGYEELCAGLEKERRVGCGALLRTLAERLRIL